MAPERLGDEREREAGLPPRGEQRTRLAEPFPTILIEGKELVYRVGEGDSRYRWLTAECRDEFVPLGVQPAGAESSNQFTTRAVVNYRLARDIDDNGSYAASPLP